MLLESFIVYTLFAIIMYFCAKSAQIDSNKQIALKGKDINFPKGYILCLFFFFLIAGLRYDVGVDHLSYLDDYQRSLAGKFTARDRGYEESYTFLTELFGFLGIHPIVYFGFIAVIQLFLVMYAYRKEKSIMPYMMLVLLLGGYFFDWMNGIRQLVAASIFVFSINFIIQRRFLLYLLCMLIAFTWHRSAVMLIPFYFLSYNKHVWDKRWLLLIGAAFCLIIGNTPIWVSNLSKLGSALSFIGYDFYADRIEEFVDVNSFSSFSVGPRLLCIMITYFLIILLYPKARRFFPESNIDITFKLCYVGICGYFLFFNTSLTFLRPVMYFTIFAMPMTAYLLRYLKDNKRVLMFYLLIITSMSYTYLSCMSDARANKYERKSFLYHFYFDKDEIKTR